jgi:hypothetical protein
VSGGLEPAEALEELAAGRYAFIDAGCSRAQSILDCELLFDRRPGIGFDIDPAKVAEASKRGVAVACADLTTVRFPPGCVPFASMMDFLEHLPDLHTAELVLGNLATAARDFLFIRHPSFEEMAYLRGLGVRLYWTHWSNHTNMMTLADFEAAFARLGWDRFTVVPRDRIGDSGHATVVPLSAPIDSHHYDAGRHGPKPRVRFDRPIYRYYDIFVRLNPALSDARWRDIVTRTSRRRELASRVRARLRRLLGRSG